jgi:hypothetical protein
MTAQGKTAISATFANNLGVSFVVTGLVVPAVSLTYQSAYPTTRYWWDFAIFWLIAGIVWHLISRRILGGVEE